MKLLFVQQPAQYKLDGAIEHWDTESESIKAIVPDDDGTQTLERGLYRIALHIAVTPVGGGEADVLLAATQDAVAPHGGVVPHEKSPWPDPPLRNKLQSVGVDKGKAGPFLDGAGYTTKVVTKLGH